MPQEPRSLKGRGKALSAMLQQLTFALVSCVREWVALEDGGRLACASRCAAQVVNVAEVRAWTERCKAWAQVGHFQRPMPPLPLLVLSGMREPMWLSLHYLNCSSTREALGALGALHEYLSKVASATSRLEAALARLRTGRVSSKHVLLVYAMICSSLLASN